MSKNYKGIETCKRCILPDTFPGIRFDSQTICKYCLREESLLAKAEENKDEYRKNLDKLISNFIGLVKSLILKNALDMSIPLVAFGWSPGQAPIQSAIMKTNPALILQTQSALEKAFPEDIRKSLTNYFIPKDYYEKLSERFPHNIHPLAFFDYDEERIKKELADLNWHDPFDTDTNSSNCLLNAFANQRHIERNGFHPYVWEIANMIRQGLMERSEGVEKIYSEQSPEMVKYAKERLGL